MFRPYGCKLIYPPCHGGWTWEGSQAAGRGKLEMNKLPSEANVTISRRPGILVLINDADWELEGEEAYEIQSGDNILFVSTLHGG